MTGVLAGKRGLIMGVANDRSIAWGIARAMSEAGAEMAFTYQGEALASVLHRWQKALAATLWSMWM